jgi:hypothetical protein
MRCGTACKSGSSQQERFANEPQEPTDQFEQAIASLPERAKRWYRNNPEFLTNPERAAQVQYCHFVAAREAGGEGTDSYFDKMEHLLGLRQRPQSQPAATPRNSVRQQYTGGPVSAPPSREVPSFSTGRPQSASLALTAQDRVHARMWNITDEQMLEGKRQAARENAQGLRQNG